MARDAEERGKDLETAKATIPTSVPLGPKTTMDLSWLPEEERKHLLTEYTRGMLDIGRRAQELHVDAGALQATLHTMAGTTKEVAEEGNAVTISHTQTSAVGRTEIIMGNTDQAKTGKLTKSQTGERDWTPYYVIGGLIALVLIAAAVAQ